MSKNVIETYAWDERVFERLLNTKMKGTFVAIDSNNFGKVLDVKKKKQIEGFYIQVVFKKEN
ncbi:hypothetical protein [Bacillus atrophaeus]|uniref:hypothetical protein n=1 Tax=Bacillus atrophaeus TaxID=1452 RepID=UPI002282C8E3|nr:hypothetical protein [Bacillus atrophaeus]MCY8466421.1 hypothetical protein [Bacillus atrophaeus]MCY8478880.1 hypothetical protein [Bacillus atrophaeus]